jgi:hypothetical protein
VLRRPIESTLGIQCLWFGLPTLATHWVGLQRFEPLSYDHRAYAFMWIAVGHFVQYLWITTYYATGSQGRSAHARYLVKAWCAGSALWVLPTLIFAPTALGRLPFDFGLYALTVAVVNLHHFILDGAIWKLRDGRIARVLLRDVEPASAADEPEAPIRAGWRSRTIYAVGALAFSATLLLRIDAWIASRPIADVSEHYARIRAMEERRSWFGRGNPKSFMLLARHAAEQGDLDTALLDYRRSLDIFATSAAYYEPGGPESSRSERHPLKPTRGTTRPATDRARLPNIFGLAEMRLSSLYRVSLEPSSRFARGNGRVAIAPAVCCARPR